MNTAFLYSVFVCLIAPRVASAQSETPRRAPILGTRFESQTIDEGSRLVLTASVIAGDVPWHIQWFRNGVLLEKETNSTFRIVNAQPSDSGTYRFEVSNDVGTNQIVRRVQVESTRPTINPIDLTGWNVDIITEIDGPLSQTVDFDKAGFRLYESGFLGHEDGLPRSREFTDESNANVKYRLQPYSRTNALMLDHSRARSITTNGTLTVVSPAAYTTLAILAASTGQPEPGQFFITFADDSTSENFEYSAPDWYVRNATNGIAISGLGRFFIRPGLEAFHQTLPDGFGLYSSLIDLRNNSYDSKPIRSITFNRPAGALSTSVLAVSGAPSPPRFREIEKQEGAKLRIEMDGPSSGVYVLQESQNLLSWKRSSTVPVFDDGVFQFIVDLQALGTPFRFFRAVLVSLP